MPVGTPFIDLDSSTITKTRRVASDGATTRTTYEFLIHRMETFGNPRHPLPSRITLLRPDPKDATADQLFVGELPIPRDAWRYDAHDRILSWRGAYGGGHLHLSHDGLGATGNIGADHEPCSVLAASTARVTSDVALNVGATYVSSGEGIVGFKWDPTSAAWQGADWVKQRLSLSYTVTPATPISPPTFTFEFEDNQTEAIPWDPAAGSFAGALQMGEQGGQIVWNLSFKSAVSPDDDSGPNPSTGPDSVYPYWMQAVEDAAALRINGVLEIDAVAPNGKLVGMQGTRVMAPAVGYYQTHEKAAPFGVFGGRLVAGGTTVAGARVVEDVLSWTDLPVEIQNRTGLPSSGSLRFSPDGGLAQNDSGTLTAERLATPVALAAIAAHSDFHPELHAQSTLLGQSLALTSLDIYGLLAMAPFVQNAEGAWGDAVQASVTQDLSDIMNSCVPSDLWKLLFPSTAQPSLTGELAIVADSPVPGVKDPKGWYATLSTAVLAEGMANTSDVYTKNLNGPRAAAWLKSQVGTSPVYYTHGQRLFQYRWQGRFQLTPQYLQDQIDNGPTYKTTIDSVVETAVADITANVATDSTSDPKMKQNLIDQVRAGGQYAVTNNLYWAFVYYYYNTAPAILANIALQMGTNTGSSDGTTLSRLFQQNAAVLTALDPSGFFARQYTTTINTFLATNILPSMFGFLGDAASFDIVKEYLQKFVENNLNNEDQQIAQAASQINSILQDEHADEMLKDSIEALRAFSGAIQDTLALPYISNSFLKWFQKSYPKFSSVGNIFGSVLIGGITGLAIMNLFTEFKSWDKLNTAERAQLIIDTVQLGLQIVAAVVKRGVRIYAIFGVDGMSAGQRTAAISKILASGEAEALDQGLVKIGNSTARWLGDTEGTVGKIISRSIGEETALLETSVTTTAEEASWVGKVFGRNLEEFVATRVGFLLILAGIGFSIYSIAKGEGGIQLASDIINIVSGSLMLFATVGGWLIEGGLIAAEGIMATIISVAGPLAILAALAGVGLMLYLMFKKQPDPVEEFVNDYAKPQGFYVASDRGSIDYVQPYENPDQNKLMMIGFTLDVGGPQVLTVEPTGAVALQMSQSEPASVWQVTTDGLGMSKFFTFIQPDPAKPPVPVLMTLMSDGSVSFQPPYSPPKPPAMAPIIVGPTVVTQLWKAVASGDATLTSDGKYLASLPLTIQPIMPDKDGKFDPSNASGYLNWDNTKLFINQAWSMSFRLKMSGMAPNFMRMIDLKFLLNSTPLTQQTFGPAFGAVPSTPLTFSVTPALPSFLSLEQDAGALSPNGGIAAPEQETTYQISASNPLGQASATFKIKIAPSTPPTVSFAV